MKPKSLQTSVSERGPSVESFFWSAFEPVTAPSLVPWSSIGVSQKHLKKVFSACKIVGGRSSAAGQSPLNNCIYSNKPENNSRGARGATYFVAEKGSTSLQNSLFEYNAKSRSGSERRKTVQLRSKTASSIQYNSVLVVTSQSLRGYSHFAVTTWLLRSRYGSTRSLRGFYGHYAVNYAVRKSTYSRLRKRSTSLKTDYLIKTLLPY